MSRGRQTVPASVPGQIPALDHAGERASGDAEDAGRLFPAAVHGRQDALDVLALELLEGAQGPRLTRVSGGSRRRGVPRGRTSAGRCSGPITSCSASSMARSSTFCSSRMLPGQSYARSRRCASGSTATGPRPWRAASVAQEVVDQQRDVLPPLAQRRQRRASRR